MTIHLSQLLTYSITKTSYILKIITIKIFDDKFKIGILVLKIEKYYRGFFDSTIFLYKIGLTCGDHLAQTKYDHLRDNSFHF